MLLRNAYKKSKKEVGINDDWMYKVLQWKSPSNGMISGPYFFKKVYGTNRFIEVSINGVLKEIVSGNCTDYLPIEEIE